MLLAGVGVGGGVGVAGWGGDAERLDGRFEFACLILDTSRKQLFDFQ